MGKQLLESRKRRTRDLKDPLSFVCVANYVIKLHKKRNSIVNGRRVTIRLHNRFIFARECSSLSILVKNILRNVSKKKYILKAPNLHGQEIT